MSPTAAMPTIFDGPSFAPKPEQPQPARPPQPQPPCKG